MNKVLQELVAVALKLAAARGMLIAATDAEVAAFLMVRYARCPACLQRIDFCPENMVDTCQSREEFLTRYGAAIRPHLEASPKCAKVFEETEYDPDVQ